MTSKDISKAQADLLRKLRQGATLIIPTGCRPLIKVVGAPAASYAREDTVRALEKAGYIRKGERRDRFHNALYEVTAEAPAV